MSSSAAALLALPEDALLNRILSFSLPQRECQQWEWIGVLSQTCRSFRRVAQSLAPTCLTLADFKQCERIGSTGGSFDARVGILQSLRDFSWKRQHLMELHASSSSLLLLQSSLLLLLQPRTGTREFHVGVLALLRALLTAPASFPELEWLDIEAHHLHEYSLVDAASIRSMPFALPSLKKLCLSGCFRGRMTAISPSGMQQFFRDLHTPLESLSLSGIEWMSDAHVEAMMPFVGKNLVRLELIVCAVYEDTGEDEELSDRSLRAVSKHCTKLESFAITHANITAPGVEEVLRTNRNIITLNLSVNHRLDAGTVEVISRYLPRLREIHSYGCFDRWLTDDSLIALIDAQERDSGSSSISLNLIGCNGDLRTSLLTMRGLEYAVTKGVKEFELQSP